MTNRQKIFNTIEFSHLAELRQRGSMTVSCPHCGWDLKVMENGWFNGELFYCWKEKKIFGIALKHYKNANPSYIEACEEQLLYQQTKRQITMKNVKAVAEFLKTLESKPR